MPELLDLVTRTAELAAAEQGGEAVEVFASRGRRVAVRGFRGEVESFTSADTAGVGIRVIVDGRQGFAWAGSLDEAILRETLAEARDNMSFGEQDVDNALAEPDGMARPALDLFDAEATGFPTEDKVQLALDLERAVLARDPRVRGVRSSSYSDFSGEQAIASTTGIRSWGRATTCSVSVSAMAEADGETRTGSGFDLGRSPTTLDIDRAAQEAAHQATRLLGATQPPSSRLTVVFEPSVTASLLGIIGRTLSGEAVLKGRSLFADRLGEEVAAPGVTLVDDATDPSSFGAWPDDDEGLASRRNLLMDDGVLRCFLHSSYSGRRSGAGSTGSAVRGYSSTPTVAPRALTLVPGARSQEELIASVVDGVLVQSVTGLGSGVNPVSGDFSVGAEGLRIRHGALAEAVRGMTLASTLQRMCRDIVEVGADQRWFGSGAGMSLAIRDVSIGGR